MSHLIKLFLLFIIYSFIGYISEIVYIFIKYKRITNRGFLCGPILPIYGIGSVLIIYYLNIYKNNLITIYILSALICTMLEYITSFILEKIFHNKWWDYYNHKFNINGRVCFFNTLLFGVGGVVIICYVNSYIIRFINVFNYKIQMIIFTFLILIFISDVIYSIIIALNLRDRLIIVEELKNKKIAKIPKIFNVMLRRKVKNFKMFPSRLLKAFPNINIRYFNEFKIMKLIFKKKKR